MVFVTTADGSKGIEGISYDTLKKSTRDAARDLKKVLESVENIIGESKSAEPTPSPTPSEGEKKAEGNLAEIQTWTNDAGTAIQAAVKKIDGESVIFIMNGREVSYPLAKLSADSQAKLKGLAAN